MAVELSRDLERENAALRAAARLGVEADHELQNAFEDAVTRAERAEAELASIKAAQQPVGYDTLPDSKFDAKYKHVGVSPQAQPEPMSACLIRKIMSDCGIHPSEAFGEVWTGNVQLLQFARALLAAAQEAK